LQAVVRLLFPNLPKLIKPEIVVHSNAIDEFQIIQIRCPIDRPNQSFDLRKYLYVLRSINANLVIANTQKEPLEGPKRQQPF
jgi:hypothetical protein